MRFIIKIRNIFLRSLWLQMVAAFGLVIILAVILIGWAANWITNREFDTLLREEARLRAKDIAILVESHYNAANGWEGVETLFVEPDFEAIVGVSSVAVSVEPDVIETSTGEAINFFPLADQEWDRIIATELGLSPNQYDQLRQDSSIVDLASERHIPLESLVTAVMRLELTRSNAIPAPDQVFVLSSIRYAVEGYIHTSPLLLFDDVPIEPFSNNSFIVGAFFGNERILIADTGDQVIFDSGGNVQEGQLLPDTFQEQKTAVYDWQQTDHIVGYVAVAAGEGYYFDEQLTFLTRVTKSLIVGGLLAVGMALIVGILMTRHITAPIRALTEAAAQLATSDDTQLLPVTSTDELGRMSAAFNQMTQALAEQKMLRRRLVSDVSHELNTPLSIIQLESKGMQDGMQEPAEAAVRIQKEVKLLHNLVQDLTLLADTDQLKMTMAQERVSVDAFLAEVATRWQSRLEARGILLRVEKHSEPIEVEMDPIRMSQVMGNLIRNAIQHTPAGGTIILSVRQEMLPASDQEWVVITVRDTGEGIPAHDLPYIFERFYRVDMARQRQGNEQGLGLAIVKQLVDQHNGRVWAESVLDQGSAFHIAIPKHIPEGFH